MGINKLFSELLVIIHKRTAHPNTYISPQLHSVFGHRTLPATTHSQAFPVVPTVIKIYAIYAWLDIDKFQKCVLIETSVMSAIEQYSELMETIRVRVQLVPILHQCIALLLPCPR